MRRNANKKTACSHPDENVDGRWTYEGTKLTWASGFCELCGQPMQYCQRAKQLVPIEEMVEPLPPRKEVKIKKETKLKVHFSSDKHDWETPQNLFNALHKEFNFVLDVCATHENAKCAKYFTEKEDGLKQAWLWSCWMNPPYARNIQRKWIEKAYNESQRGCTVVCLIPARTDTKLWHDYVMKAAEVRFIEGRLKFGNAKNAAPFPSAIVVFKSGVHQTQFSSYKKTK